MTAPLLDEPIGGLSNEQQHASKAKRLANYVIDSVGYTLFSGLIGALLGYFAVRFDNETLISIFADSSRSLLKVIDYFFGFAVVIVYYLFFEYGFRGKTPGKWLTGTRAITLDGRPLDFRTALKRSAIRCIPFEFASFLGEKPGTGWHDLWSETMVIEERAS